MADWNEDSAQLEDNLNRLLRQTIRPAAARRELPTVEAARRWHIETLRNLQVPDAKFVGAFRGEAGLEKIQVRIGGRYGVAAPQVAAELAHFEQTLQRVVRRLDELLPPGKQLEADQLAAILEVCAWAHAEWVRIHPFANGNGRTARLWANSLALRYGLPPFLRLRPRPAGAYAIASESAMLGDWDQTLALFQQLLADFLNDPERGT
jgi:Fic family protein